MPPASIPVRTLDGDVLCFDLEGPMTLDGLRAAGAAIAETCLRVLIFACRPDSKCQLYRDDLGVRGQLDS